MSIISLDMYQATAVAALVFVIGKILVDRIALLRRYCIPAPVVGGLLYALIHLAVRSAGILEVEDVYKRQASDREHVRGRRVPRAHFPG